MIKINDALEIHAGWYNNRKFQILHRQYSFDLMNATLILCQYSVVASIQCVRKHTVQGQCKMKMGVHMCYVLYLTHNKKNCEFIFNNHLFGSVIWFLQTF